MGKKPSVPYEEMPNMKFGRLKPLVITESKGRTKWLCQCDCGKQVEVIQKNLCNGNTRSCGCLSAETNPKRTHGLSKTRLYTMYSGVKARCYNPNNVSYQYYGAKGISMCEEWKNDFLTFKSWSDENGYDESLPRGMQTLDRISPSGNYCPENCRWITIGEQQRNKDCLTKYEYNGEEHLVCEWAEILGIDEKFLRSRVNRGWDIKTAIENPKFKKVKRRMKKITFMGETHTLREWEKITGISYDTILGRYKKGLAPELILFNGKLKRGVKKA